MIFEKKGRIKNKRVNLKGEVDMKKLFCLGVCLTVLSGCTPFDPDLDKAAEKRAESRAEIRTEIGCQFADSHSAYRRCILSTYENNKPKTFITSQNCKGEPLAIVSDAPIKETVAPSDVIVEKTTKTTSTEQPAPTPVPQQQQVVQTAPAGQVQLVGTCGSTTAPCYYQQQAIYEEVIPCPSCNQPPMVVEHPKTVTIEKTETVVEKPVEVVPMPQPLPEKTWWETYQETKQPVQPKVVCPCPDPNDPCPQCVTK